MRKKFDYIMQAEIIKYCPWGTGKIISYCKNIVGYIYLKDRVNLCEKTMRPYGSNAYYWDDFIQIIIYDGATRIDSFLGTQKINNNTKLFEEAV